LGGLIVTQVSAGGPAARAGLQVGDVVVSVSEIPVHDPRELSEAIDPSQKSARVTFLRYLTKQATDIPLSTNWRPRSEPTSEPDEASADFGLRFLPLAAIAPGATGVILTEVEQGRLAAKAGLRIGDVLVTIGKTPLKDDYQHAFKKLKGARQAAMLVLRQRVDFRTLVKFS
jgi:serine protease Do